VPISVVCALPSAVWFCIVSDRRARTKKAKCTIVLENRLRVVAFIVVLYVRNEIKVVNNYDFFIKDKYPLCFCSGAVFGYVSAAAIEPIWSGPHKTTYVTDNASLQKDDWLADSASQSSFSKLALSVSYVFLCRPLHTRFSCSCTDIPEYRTAAVV